MRHDQLSRDEQEDMLIREREQHEDEIELAETQEALEAECDARDDALSQIEVRVGLRTGYIRVGTSTVMTDTGTIIEALIRVVGVERVFAALGGS